MEIITALGSVLFIILSADALGRLPPSAILKDIYEARIGLGLAVISYFIFFLGIFKLLNSPVILFSSLLIFLPLFFANLKNYKSTLRRTARYFYQQICSMPMFDKFIFSVLSVYFVLLFLNTLTPPTCRDSLTYHLYLPKIWLKEQRIFSLPENIYSFFPHFWEMLYAYALLLGGDIGAKLLHLFTIFLSARLIARIIKLLYPRIERRYILLSILVFVSTPTIGKIATWAYVDLAQTYYLLLSFYFLFLFLRGERKITFYLSAIFLGCALAIKYLSLVWLLFLPFLILEKKIEEKKGKEALFLIGAYVTTALSCALPYYLKNYFDTGNPFYPFFYGIFGGRFLDAGKSVLLDGYFKSFGYGNGLGDLLFLPIRLAFFSRFENHQKFDGEIGIIYLLLAVIFICKYKKIDLWKSLIYLPFIGVLLWFAASQQVRFLIPLLAVFIIIAIGPLGRVNKFYLNLVLAIISALYLYYPTRQFIEARPYNFILNRESRPAYLVRSYPIVYPLIEKINRYVPRDSKIMLLMTGQIAYLFQRDVYQEVIFEDYSLRKALRKGVGETMGFFKNNRITFILINESAVAGYFDEYAGKQVIFNYLELRRKYLKPVYRQNGFGVYEIIFPR
jgi:hypothetical protein